MANSSSALTLISRAFSRASCLMNASCDPHLRQALCVHGVRIRLPDMTTYHLVHLAEDLIVIERAARHLVLRVSGGRVGISADGEEEY